MKWLAVIVAVLILPFLAYSQATGNNPIFDIVPTIDCDAANSKMLWDLTTGRFSCGVDQTGQGGSVTVSSSTVLTANDSNNKSATAWCPPGKMAVGGGASITSGANTDLHLEQSFPTATSSGWTASVNEGDALASNWQFRVHAICI